MLVCGEASSHSLGCLECQRYVSSTQALGQFSIILDILEQWLLIPSGM